MPPYHFLSQRIKTPQFTLNFPPFEFPLILPVCFFFDDAIIHQARLYSNLDKTTLLTFQFIDHSKNDTQTQADYQLAMPSIIRLK